MTIGGVEALYRKNLKPQIESIQQIQDEFLETYLADAEFLADVESLNHNLVPNGTEGEDAGPTLNPAVYWNPPSDFGRKTPLVLAKSREFIMRYEDDWIKGRTFLERGSIKADIGLFTGLERFKFWDLERGTPLEHLAGRGEFVMPSQMPVPDTLDLLTAVKVRLIRGSIDSQPMQALKDVRQFAKLLLSTENFQLVMTGLAALELERRAYRDYIDHDWVDNLTWLPIDRNTAMRAARAYTATAGYLRALTRESTFKKVFANGKIPPGLCAAVNEQLPLEYAYRSQLTGWWPLEHEYNDGFKRLDEVFEMAKKHCRLRFLRGLQEKGALPALDPEAPFPLARVPYFRTLFAQRDWAAWPTHFDAYQRR